MIKSIPTPPPPLPHPHLISPQITRIAGHGIVLQLHTLQRVLFGIMFVMLTSMLYVEDFGVHFYKCPFLKVNLGVGLV